MKNLKYIIALFVCISFYNCTQEPIEDVRKCEIRCHDDHTNYPLEEVRKCEIEYRDDRTNCPLEEVQKCEIEYHDDHENCPQKTTGEDGGGDLGDGEN
ncbi:hypothetical protein POV27_03525 [Aureisphaera galaxeae]|uniref:hypothetical protein n=1 Tax=Aureisphaera galaxeae TaxID=1538023 RepID=UPI0023500CB8|nr:hypothetical protein [Aureisphaera galaxeae]MDC8003104.1 hypothetical protein [Aureisphaera galaxeae]